jgi:hypothetical protein
MERATPDGHPHPGSSPFFAAEELTSSLVLASTRSRKVWETKLLHKHTQYIIDVLTLLSHVLERQRVSDIDTIKICVGDECESDWEARGGLCQAIMAGGGICDSSSRSEAVDQHIKTRNRIFPLRGVIIERGEQLRRSSSSHGEGLVST